MVRWTARIAVALLGIGGTALAHHSYSMFDFDRSVAVEGSIAKVQWTNPHAYVWVYVKKADKPGGHDLFGFECDSPNQLRAHGWSKDSLKAGDRVAVDYFPLRDGRSGGHLVRVRRADGSVLTGARETIGVPEELERLEKGRP